MQIIYLDEDKSEFVVRATFEHPYPTTKIIWIPDNVRDVFFLDINTTLIYLELMHGSHCFSAINYYVSHSLWLFFFSTLDSSIYLFFFWSNKS